MPPRARGLALRAADVNVRVAARGLDDDGHVAVRGDARNGEVSVRLCVHLRGSHDVRVRTLGGAATHVAPDPAPKSQKLAYYFLKNKICPFAKLNKNWCVCAPHVLGGIGRTVVEALRTPDCNVPTSAEEVVAQLRRTCTAGGSEKWDRHKSRSAISRANGPNRCNDGAMRWGARGSTEAQRASTCASHAVAAAVQRAGVATHSCRATLWS